MYLNFITKNDVDEINKLEDFESKALQYDQEHTNHSYRPYPYRFISIFLKIQYLC